MNAHNCNSIHDSRNQDLLIKQSCNLSNHATKWHMNIVILQYWWSQYYTYDKSAMTITRNYMWQVQKAQPYSTNTPQSKWSDQSGLWTVLTIQLLSEPDHNYGGAGLMKPRPNRKVPSLSLISEAGTCSCYTNIEWTIDSGMIQTHLQEKVQQSAQNASWETQFSASHRTFFGLNEGKKWGRNATTKFHWNLTAKVHECCTVVVHMLCIL